jgi:hypothetical protein
MLALHIFQNTTANDDNKRLNRSYPAFHGKHALAVASYSALLLASLQAFGAERGKAYAELPKWRRKAYRPSCLDLITLLRKEITQQTALLHSFALKFTPTELVQAAAA